MSQKVYKISLVIDDPALEAIIVKFIKPFPQLIVSKTASITTFFNTKISLNSCDLLILNIENQEVNILNLLKKHNASSYTILISTSNKYAVKAFELGLLDYIIKPFSKKRFSISMQRFLDRCNSRGFNGNNTQNNLFYKYKNKLFSIPIYKINFISAIKRNTLIETDEEQFTCPFSISELELKFSKFSFIRIHKSYIVNSSLIKNMVHKKSGLHDLNLNDSEDTILPVGRKYSNSVKKYLSEKF